MDPLSDSQRWQAAQKVLDALEHLPAAERRTAAENHDYADPRVREEVLSLLDAEHGEAGFLESSPLRMEAEPDAAAATLAPGTEIGAFRIDTLIGRGGMAEVYRARRISDFEQRVAIKLLTGDARVDFFQRERRILATLEHPGIARILDGGSTAAGRPYLVMELVEGTDLISHASERRLDLQARLELFRQICEAVAYAHQRLIVHRDLKPANIRVTPQGQVKLLDFGVAKLIGAETRTDELETATILTPEFAAPEQMYGEPVTTATDVYALGAVLFQLLSGLPPFKTKGQALHLVIDTLLRSDMPQMSGVAASQAEPPVPSRLLRGDLDAIVARATRKKPAERYASVVDFWTDLARYLDHRPVLARRGSTAYRVQRYLRRNRVGVVAGLAVALTLIGGVTATLWQARVAIAAEQQSREQAARLKRSKDFFVSLFSGASAYQRVGEAPVSLDEAVNQAIADVERKLDEDPVFYASLLSDFGEIRAGQGEFEEARRMFDLAIGQLEPRLKADDPEMISVLLNRGAIGSYLGNTEEGRDHLERAVALLEKSPNRRTELANALNNLAVLEFTADRLDRALDLSQRALELARVSPGERDRMLAATLSQLGIMFLSRQDHLAARAHAEEALAVIERNYGPRSANLGPPLQVLAMIAQNGDRPEAALPYLQRFLELARLNHPAGHPDIGAALLSLAKAEQTAGNESAAESHAHEAMVSFRVGNYVGSTAFEVHQFLATLQWRRGDFNGLTETLSAAEQRCAQASEPQAIDYCRELQVMRLRVQIAQAADRAIVESARRQLGTIIDAASPREAMADALLARSEALDALGDHAAAAADLERLASLSTTDDGSVVLDAYRSRWLWIAALCRQGDETALRQARKVFEQTEAAVKTEVDRADASFAAAMLTQAEGDSAEAARHRQAALQGFEALGPYYASVLRRARELLATLP